MFGLFSKKRKYSHLNEKERSFIEDELLWLQSCYSLKSIKDTPFVFLHDADFLLSVSKNLAEEFERICNRCRMDVSSVLLCVFDDLDSKTWEKWRLTSNADDSPTFELTDDDSKELFRADIFKSTLKDPFWSIFIFGHQLSGISLEKNNYMKRNDPAFFIYNDAAAIYLGYGIIAANCVDKPSPQEWTLTEQGYHFDKVIYAIAVICLMTNTDYKSLLPHLTERAASQLTYEAEILLKYGDTKINPEELTKRETIADLIDSFILHERNNNFKKVFDITQELLQFTPNDSNITNNAGYSLLRLKKYEEAVVWFNRSIEKDPYFSFPFNNRGYCFLMLGKYSQAKVDFDTAIELGQDNAYAWRNKAIYAMIQNKWNNVLELLNKAYEIDAKTELIHFYRSIAHSNLGNKDEALHFKKLSEEINEYNDSIFTFDTIFTPQNHS